MHLTFNEYISPLTNISLGKNTTFQIFQNIFHISNRVSLKTMALQALIWFAYDPQYAEDGKQGFLFTLT